MKEYISRNINILHKERLTFGERAADGFAKFAGSWVFIFGFIIVFLLWIAINSILLVIKPFDPYPFILLNLVLSCLAAIQAPVIMMSQNREAKRDRIRADHDYEINLKAEKEIEELHRKIDQLIVEIIRLSGGKR
ncbi:MAG: DUF1003 domain-containing protein [Actinobacteria bacterium]|nr:DUF1003 domain-containing protein [Actinomycetota bacterium]